MLKPPVQLGSGYYWQDVVPGDRFVTLNRTITESDLVSFIGTTGMLETIFIDSTYTGAMSGRPIPAILTHAVIEGLQLQTMLQNTALALLELSLKTIAPVQIGDTIRAEIEILNVRPTSKNGRGVVSSHVAIFNQRNELCLSYDALRLVAGRPQTDA